MKIAIFSPNLTRNSGGAETYALKIANVLSEHHQVVFYTCASRKPDFDMNKIYQHYGSECFETRYVSFVFTGGHEYLKELGYIQLRHGMMREISKEFDLFINCTFSRISGPEGVKSIHIIHFPDISNSTVFGRQIGKKKDAKYLRSYDLLLCNSEFTNENLRRRWGVTGQVLYPLITMDTIPAEELEKKEKIILTVDRFHPEKKVLEMMEAFIRFKQKDTAGYRMVIVGNADSKWKDYAEKMNRLAEGQAIEIRTSVPYEELLQWYRKATIYWHAMGLGVSEDNPAAMEHFGVTTVEAMANGVIPIVIGKGGQREIVASGTNGFLCDTPEDMIENTLKLTQDEDRIRTMRLAAVERAKDFLMPAFRAKLEGYVSSLFKGDKP